MNKPAVCVHALVKNEENFLWYAVTSLVDYVDKIYVWDTGSTDKTVQLIKELIERWPQKIEFKEVGRVDSSTLVATRQKMLKLTKSDWIMVLDGDEIWWKESIEKVLNEISRLPEDVLGIATPFYNCVGDIFHYQPKSAGRYNLAGKEGHVNLRFMRNKSGMTVQGVYPYEYYSIKNSRPLQETGKIEFIDTPYLHLSHLNRSSAESKRKQKTEIGISFSPDFYYPEAFFKPRPSFIPSPWLPASASYKLIAGLETPFKRIRRKLTTNG